MNTKWIDTKWTCIKWACTDRLLRNAMIFCCLCGVLTGCGHGRGGKDAPARAAVSGNVTLNGVPLEEGVIRFVPIKETPGPKTSLTIQQGAFKSDAITGPVVGTHRIEIESTDTGGYAIDDETAIQRLKAQNIKRIIVTKIPAIYNQDSRLTASVTLDGPNELTFNLETPKRR